MNTKDRICLIRTLNAGVHFGTVEARDGRAQEVWLKDARRIWNWHGANTLHELALNGCNKESKVSEPVPELLLSGVIEIIPISDAAVKQLGKVGWAK